MAYISRKARNDKPPVSIKAFIKDVFVLAYKNLKKE